jgi:hypothetical protein
VTVVGIVVSFHRMITIVTEPGGAPPAAACVTATVCHPIVSVAVRSAPVFGATVTVTVPLPVPLLGLGVAQSAVLVAVQPQVPRLAVRATFAVVPAAGTDSRAVESE